MERTIHILNELESSGLIERYAIGGAMGAMFYSEAVLTEDLDVFVALKALPAGLISLSPIYDFLKARGAVEREEHLVIHGVPVQILPAYDALTEEALAQATEQPFGQTRVRVMRVEHLLAIALKTGRAKDHARVALLMEEADLNATLLEEIIERHGLHPQWNRFRSQTP